MKMKTKENKTLVFFIVLSLVGIGLGYQYVSSKTDVCENKFIKRESGIDALEKLSFEKENIPAQNLILSEADNKYYCVFFAKTKEQKAKGLGFVEHLENDLGMLFIFDFEDTHDFWNRNTLIGLDILWLDASFKVVHIERATKTQGPADEIEVYNPGVAAKYVLEVNANQAEKISVGDYFQIKRI